MAQHDERNKRTAGYRRVSASRERVRAKFDAGDDVAADAPDSLVALLPSAPTVADCDIRDAAAAVFGADGDGEPDGDAVEVRALGVVRVGGWVLRVKADARPYFDDPAQAAEAVPELRLRAAVRDHAGFLAVELLAAPDGTDPADRAARVCWVLAALAPADALALHRPGTGQLGLFTPEAAAALAGGDVDDALRPPDHPVPIAGVDGDDPRMAAAAAEAARRFGEFVAALDGRRPGDTFAVKVPFADEHGLEFMWVSVTAVDDAHIHGRLDNDPAFVRSIRAGQLVRVPRAQLNDWLFVRGGRMHGGFTLKLLDDKLRRPGDAA